MIKEKKRKRLKLWDDEVEGRHSADERTRLPLSDAKVELIASTQKRKIQAYAERHRLDTRSNSDC